MIITTEGYNLDHFRKGGGAAYFTKHSVVYSSKITYVVTQFGFCFSHFLENMITSATRATDKIASPFWSCANSPRNFSHSRVIDLGLSNNDLINLYKKTVTTKIS